MTPIKINNISLASSCRACTRRMMLNIIPEWS
jgi:hypothetical protein